MGKNSIPFHFSKQNPFWKWGVSGRHLPSISEKKKVSACLQMLELEKKSKLPLLLGRTEERCSGGREGLYNANKKFSASSPHRVKKKHSFPGNMPH